MKFCIIQICISVWYDSFIFDQCLRRERLSCRLWRGTVCVENWFLTDFSRTRNYLKSYFAASDSASNSIQHRWLVWRNIIFLIKMVLEGGFVTLGKRHLSCMLQIRFLRLITRELGIIWNYALQQIRFSVKFLCTHHW